MVVENRDLNIKIGKFQRKIDNQQKLSLGGFEWKHRGNCLQFKYNLGLVNILTEAATSLEYEELDEAKDLIK